MATSSGNEKKLSIVLIAGLWAVCISFIILHGTDPKRFVVDGITLALLGLILLPFLGRFVSEVKFGEVEMKFKDLPKEDKILVFIDSMIADEQATFFRARKGESQLGMAFAKLIKYLKINDRAQLIRKAEEWMKSPDKNIKWFAAEVIGFARLAELRSLCEEGAVGDYNNELPTWKLNCLWALSRIDGYERLIDAIKTTKNEHNRKWLVEACLQMLYADGDADNAPDNVERRKLKTAVAALINSNEIAPEKLEEYKMWFPEIKEF